MSINVRRKTHGRRLALLLVLGLAAGTSYAGTQTFDVNAAQGGTLDHDLFKQKNQFATEEGAFEHIYNFTLDSGFTGMAVLAHTGGGAKKVDDLAWSLFSGFDKLGGATGDTGSGVPGGLTPPVNQVFNLTPGADYSLAVTGIGNLNDFYNMHLRAIAAVPVPAAVWLFGSGIAGLMVVSRRRKAQQAEPLAA